MNIYAHGVAIVGVTGYAGQELERLLASHPKIQIAGKFASKANEKSGAEAFSFERLRCFSADAVVLATEHELSMQLVPQLLAEAIASARIVANPGCYATAAVLPLIPLYKANAVDPECTVVVDGKSGVSGAGRQPKSETHFCEVNENISAYSVLKHRHTPEMVAQLPGATFDRFVFTAHLVPISRGILNTITLRTQNRISAHSVLAEIYAKTPFVQVLSPGQLPNVHSVTKTNLCVIGTVARGDNTVIVSVLDNLVKGAAGQAVQNLNLMFGYEPTAGLVS